MKNASLVKGLLLILILFIVSLIAWSFLKSEEESNDAPDTTLPNGGVVVTDQPVIGQEGEHIPTLKIKGSNERVSVRNFLSDESVVQLADDYYQITNSSDADGEYASSYYYSDDGGIIILLLREPLAVSRLFAEDALRSLLGISDESMCELEILVQTNRYVNISYAGRNLGLSFCEGSVSLQ